MAFMLRRPFAVTTVLKQVPTKASNPSISNASARFFHHNASFKRASSPILSSSKQTFQNAFRRTYMQPTYRVDQGTLTQRLLYGAAIVGGTVLATNLIFNRETREDGGMPPYERSYLNETFLHTGLGVGIIGIAARAMHMNGWSYRLMTANPWAVVGLSLVASIGTMYATYYTPPEK